MIKTKKETYQPPMQIITVASHSQLSIDCQAQKCFDNLGYIWSLCRHFRASAHGIEANND